MELTPWIHDSPNSVWPLSGVNSELLWK